MFNLCAALVSDVKQFWYIAISSKVRSMSVLISRVDRIHTVLIGENFDQAMLN